MKFAIRTAFVVAVATLSGCASTEIVSSIPTPKSSAVGHITVCRKRIFYGDGAATIIYIDGEATLRSGPGVCFAAFLKTGTHSISVLEDSWLGPNMGKNLLDWTPEKNSISLLKMKISRRSKPNTEL
jgi:hypothetical protein